MKISKEKLSSALGAGLSKGWGGYIWILKILVPISFFTMLLDYSGWISRVDFLLTPLMGVLNLPALAALPLIIGMLTGIYGAVAAMTVLPLTPEQMTLIAIFLLISHSLIQEGIIQGNSGMNPFTATAFRVTVSVITVMAVAPFLVSDIGAVAAHTSPLSAGKTFLPVLKAWGLATAMLCIRIFFIIMTVMILLQIMKAFDLIRHIIRGIGPVLRLMGLDERVGVLWLTAAIFGISYGGAVIVEEAGENEFSREELSRLHLSIGINHAMIEDPALFLPLGISPFWLWVPRLTAALVSVHLLRICQRFRNRKSSALIPQEGKRA